MKKFAKILVIALIILSMFSLLVACGEDDGASDQNDVNQNVNDNVNTPSDDNITDDDSQNPTPSKPSGGASNLFVFEKIGGKSEYRLKSASVVDGLVVIPSTYFDQPVTEIAPKAFYSLDKIEEVVIPDSVKVIGDMAFAQCQQLKKVTISSTSLLEVIGERAFFCDNELSTIALPESLKKIGKEALRGCYDLVELTFPQNLVRVGEYAVHETAWYDAIKESGVVYLSKVAYSFICLEADPTLQNITLKSDTISVADKAFYGNEDVLSITIPGSVTHVGALALNNIPNLENIIVDAENELYSHSGNALVEKETATLIATTKNTVVPNFIEIIGEEAFSFSTIENVVLPETVKSFGARAFWGSKVKSINLPLTLTTISEKAFYKASQLESIVIHKNITTIQSAAFNGCTSLKEVIIENATILAGIDLPYSWSGLTNWATTVYVHEDAIEELSERDENEDKLADRLTDDKKATISDKENYVKYILEGASAN